ncbi:MAG: gliding motility-associated ABC transporter substrate-binding protein GldG [Porphyromonadaceae bacterium]|jgi:ABC-2 type transport system permease protein|nr:gliding motility-associated ABC transporter substrate-binding protein GldG [Porphyromonadaceae bacterium]
MKFFDKNNLLVLVSIIMLIVISQFFHIRIDLTSDKRHSISKQTKDLIKSIDEPIEAVVYLTGDLNSGFLRLKNSATDLLKELNAYGKSKLTIRFVNPSDADTESERIKNHELLSSRGMEGTAVYERDKEGKAIQKIVFPWLELTFQNKTTQVNLLKNDKSLSGEENLNISIENLEFEITDALRRLTKKDIEKIAFLEGHGELDELETYEASKSLSRYFQIDRGIIGTEPDILNEYKCVIIAGPTSAFSEKDKFILDQYLMKGGSILWLVDGVQISEENLSTSGISPAMPLELQLNDLLFRYGARINPVILEDVQSTLIPVNIAPAGEKPHFEPIPWVYSPLLLTASDHTITKNIPPVKAQFASLVDFVGNSKSIDKKVILATSTNTHITQTPAQISLAFAPDLKDKNYFNYSNVPVGVVLEGVFESAFANRMVPKEISSAQQILKSSKITKQIIFANSGIIRNEIEHTADSIRTLPLGFDRYMNQQFGNKELITNSVLYLTDKDGWMQLRSRTIPLRLLNKNKINTQRTNLQLLNVVSPLIVLLIFGLIYHRIRRIRYSS